MTEIFLITERNAKPTYSVRVNCNGKQVWEFSRSFGGARKAAIRYVRELSVDIGAPVVQIGHVWAQK